MIFRISIIIFLCWQIFSSTALCQFSFQSPVGPQGSVIKCFASDSSGNIYAGGNNIYKSTDDGNSWIQIGNNLNILSLAINKSGDIFAGGNLLLRSTNVGISWEILGAEIYCSDCNMGVIKIGSDGSIYVGTSNGIFRSTNNGANFSSLGVNGNQIYDIDINEDGVIFATTNGGIWRSYDEGESFIPPVLGELQVPMILKKNTKGVYLATTATGVFRSDDRCITWTQLNQQVWLNDLVIQNDTNIFTSTYFSGIQRSTDSGNTWQPVNVGLNNLLITSIFSSNGILLAGCNGGIFKSSDYADNWATQNIGLGFVPLRGFVVTPDQKYYVATPGGIYSSDNQGQTWNNLNGDLDNTDTYSISISPTGTIFISNSWKTYRSVNNGQNWEPMTNGLPESMMKSIFFLKGDTILVTLFEGLYRSINSGNSWQLLYRDPNYQNLTSIIQDSSGILYGLQHFGLASSTDRGESWVKKFSDFNRPWSLTSNSAGHLFVADEHNGTMRSLDGGESFVKVNLALENSPHRSIAINSNGYVFSADINNTIFYSPNNGKTWYANTDLNQILQQPFSIDNIVFDKEDYFYVITGTDGIYKSSSSVFSTKIPNFFIQESFSLGRQRISQEHDTTLVFFNIGADSLKISTITSTNKIFRLKDSVFTIPPHSEYKDTLNFNLPILGAQYSLFNISHNSASLEDTVFIDTFGFGIPKILFSTDTLDFGKIDYDDYKDSLFTIQNIGDDTLEIFKKIITASSFKSKNSYSLLLPGEQVVDTVIFDPLVLGDINAEIIFSANTEIQKDTIYLAGYANPFPILSLSKRYIDFGEVKIGETKTSKCYILNSGTDTLKIKKITVSDTSFSVSQDSMIIIPQASHEIIFTYAPSFEGRDSSVVLIENNSRMPVDTMYLLGAGNFLVSSDQDIEALKEFKLNQNYPNPFNSSTLIKYALPLESLVKILVYNSLGEVVDELVNEFKQAGNHEIIFNADKLPSGVYFCLFEVKQSGVEKNIKSIMKMILLK